MIDEQLRCGNPACGLPIVVLPGHRRRQYCNEAQYYASCHEVQSSKPEKTLHPQRPVYHVTDPTFLLRKARFLGKTGRRERKSVILYIFWQWFLPISWQCLDARSGLTLTSY